jgi:hypothetical protein
MSREMLLAGDGVQFVLRVDGLENPNGEGSDAEWLRCVASIAVAGFGTAASPFAMTKRDLARLANMCDEVLALKETRTFEIEEENISIAFAPNARGQLRIRCVLRQRLLAEAAFEADFVSDPSFLSSFSRGVHDAVFDDALSAG